jgi:drug/metabolite transporter (DMT)-like permease
MTTKQKGVLAVLGASCMWAIEPICAKLAYKTSGALETSAFRAIGVTLIALVYALATNGGSLAMRRKEWPAILYLALAGTVCADLLYYYALTSVPVINAVLIGHMQPVFIVLIGFFLLKEDKLFRSDYIGIAILIVSGTLVATRDLDNLLHVRLGTKGDLIVVAATALWASTAIVMRKYLRHLNAGIITFYRFLIAGIVLSVFATWRAVDPARIGAPESLQAGAQALSQAGAQALSQAGAQALSEAGAQALSQAGALVSSPGSTDASCWGIWPFPNLYQLLAGLVVGVGTLLYYEAMKRIKAAQVSALELSAPFFAAGLAYVTLGERATPMQITGILLLIVGVHFISRKEHAA